MIHKTLLFFFSFVFYYFIFYHRPSQTDTNVSSVALKTDDDSVHHHYNYDAERPLADLEADAEANIARPSAVTLAVTKRRDVPYKPRVGEIHVRDSVLYRQTPKNRLREHKTRRNYWPVVNNAVSALVTKTSANANAVKNLFKVNFYNHFDNINAAVEHKKQKIKSVLIKAAQDAKIQQWLNQHYPKSPPLGIRQPIQKPHASKLNMPPPVIVYTNTKTLPSTTISDDYVHSYDNRYVPPKYLPHGLREKNPYAGMGVTSFKHFENTVLKELEEKEERKVEATLHTIFEEQSDAEESIFDSKPQENDITENGWSPIGNNLPAQTAFRLPHPYPISEVHPQPPYGDIRPVCEHFNDIHGSPPLFYLGSSSNTAQQQAESNVNTISVLPDSKRIKPKRPVKPVKHVKHVKHVKPTKPIFHFQRQNQQISTERPNYPEYFIKQQQQVQKQQQKLLTSARNTSHGHKVLQRQKLGHQIHATASTTSSPLFYFPINGSDDGFRPIIPTDISSYNAQKPIWIRTTIAPTEPTTRKAYLPTSSTSTTEWPKITTKIPQIQTAASNPQASIVSAPKKSTTVSIDSAIIRKNPKKVRANTNSTTTYKPVQKTYRGSIKFNDGLRNDQP